MLTQAARIAQCQLRIGQLVPRDMGGVRQRGPACPGIGEELPVDRTASTETVYTPLFVPDHSPPGAGTQKVPMIFTALFVGEMPPKTASWLYPFGPVTRTVLLPMLDASTPESSQNVS